MTASDLYSVYELMVSFYISLDLSDDSTKMQKLGYILHLIKSYVIRTRRIKDVGLIVVINGWKMCYANNLLRIE